MTAESTRHQEVRDRRVPWEKWGPSPSERRWGTVREDYSDSDNARDCVAHHQARSRAYRWDEDGLAGISDDKQLPCLPLTLRNGQDPCTGTIARARCICLRLARRSTSWNLAKRSRS